MTQKLVRCTCPRGSGTTRISMSASTTQRTSASSFDPTTRCCQTTNRYRSAIMGAHRPSVRRAPHVRRPNGQRKGPAIQTPSFGASQRLDYELELGVWIGPGNLLGEPIPCRDAGASVSGYCLLNDWSARDIQAWEYQPLGPFLSKNFASTTSAWVITPEALAPFRTAQDHAPTRIRHPFHTCSMRRRPAGGRTRPRAGSPAAHPGHAGERSVASSSRIVERPSYVLDGCPDDRPSYQ